MANNNEKGRKKGSKAWLGRLFKRGKVFYLEIDQRNADGEVVRLVKSLKTGNREEAEKKAKEFTDPLRGKREAEHLEKWLVEKAASTRTKVARVALDEAWNLHPYDTNTRGERRQLKPRVVEDNKQAWNKFVAWMKANRHEKQYLGQVTEADAKAYSDDCQSNGIGPRGINLRITICRVMFDLAGITPNPFKFKNWKMKEDAVARKTLTNEEERRLLDIATGEMRTLIIIGLCTGMRLGDCCTLEWADISNGRICKRTAKRGQNVSLAIHPLLAQELSSLPKDEKYVLPGLANTYLRNPAFVSRKTGELFESAGIEVKERLPGRKKAVSRKNFHCLRHTFITQCARRGVPKSLISSWIGHSPQIDEIYQQWDIKERDNMILGAQGERLDHLITLPSDNVIDVVGTEILPPRERLHQLVDAMSDEDALVWLEKMKG